ncbi:hypothetical protein F183_A00190 [Bryobacterales bacterium F-183]|nr:hypothetical protein F183_A00190 [Bryobacterales bacterium F-183]
MQQQENCRSFRYFLHGFGIRVLSRRSRFLALLLWVTLSAYLALEVAGYARPWMQDRFPQGAYIALIFATKWILVLSVWLGVPMLVWALALGLTRRFHTFPPCSSCKKTDAYRWIKPEVFGWEQGRIFRYHCGFCGDWFLRFGKRFFILDENFTIRSYQTLVDGRRWETDRDPQVPAALLQSRRDAWKHWSA